MLIFMTPMHRRHGNRGIILRPSDRKILMKSDYLRKEAELYIDYISRDEDVSANQFMTKTLKDVNEGSKF